MHIEILRAGNDTSVVSQPLEMQLAGGEPGRVRPVAGTRRGLAADTIRPIAAADAAQPTGPSMLVQVDGQTVVEMAGLHGAGVVLEGGGWMPAGELPALSGDKPSVPSFFGQTTNDRAPLLGGTAEAGSLVLVGVGDAVFCVTANPEGEWMLDTATAVPMSGRFDLGADGSKDLLVTSIDVAGNSSGIAGVFMLRTRAPAAPTLWTVTVDSAFPLLAGWAEPGSTMMVGTGGAIYCAEPDAEGCWLVDTASETPASGKLNLGVDGSKNVVLACTDAAGNSSTGEALLTLDTSAPSRPVVARLAAKPLTPVVIIGPALSGRRAGTTSAASSPLLSSVADATKNVLAAFGARRERQQQHRRV